jgi:hypothetical protein
MARCFRGKAKFVLRDWCQSAKPTWSHEGVSEYCTEKNPQIEASQLVYFAISVFWRAAARSWRIRFHAMRPIRLGKYLEVLRLFLLGKSGSPSECSLSVQISTTETPVLATHFPVSAHAGNAVEHRFYIPGVEFTLSISKHRNRQERHTCIASGNGHPIFTSGAIDGAIRKRFRIRLKTGKDVEFHAYLLRQATAVLQARST